ncbi:MAG: hypothetical protein KBD55_02215 [Candidatus Pacebacteria bacterium]|jgi:hypothetical protein|nr:hypothetical protein [Candidatus Paceibacterota bacterium]
MRLPVFQKLFFVVDHSGSCGGTSDGGRNPRKRNKKEVAERNAEKAADAFFNAQNDVVRVQKELENANEHYWNTFWSMKKFWGGNLVEAAMMVDEMENNLVTAREVLASARVAAIAAAKVAKV